jgi:tetratricopeptide (TPR) repeat protein
MKLSLPDNYRSMAVGDWVDAAIELVLGALLMTMPFALGVVAPWSEAIVIASAAVIALLLSARAWLVSDRQQTITWALTPIMLFIAMAALQLLPLPASIVGALSPHTLAVRTQLLSDLPGAAGLLNRITLSFYPAATAHDLRLVLVYTVVFLAAVQVLRRERQYVRMMWAVCLSGGAAAVLALLQDLSESNKIYWWLDSGHPVANGGPFISYSNYSQYINLCTGAALGLLLYRLRRDDILPDKGSAASRKPRAGWQLRELKNWRCWPLLAVAVLGCVTLFLSLSRGGMLSLLCASSLTVLMLGRRRGMRGAAWVLALLLLAAFTCLLYFGFDAVCERLATLKNAPDPSAGRIQTFKDILVEWRQFPLFGTGLGTHEYVYPMFDRSLDPWLAEYADSDYFQVLEEMGIVGVVLVLSFAGYVWFCYAKAIRRGRPRLNVIAYGLGFGLLAVMLQSMTDFGQHLPAIGCISAVFCGMLVNLSRSPNRRGPAKTSSSGVAAGSTSPRFVGLGPRWPRLATSAALTGAMVWAVLGANATRSSQAASDRAAAIADHFDLEGWEGADNDFAQLLAEASEAVSQDPSNVIPRYTLACYRWRVASRGDDDQGPPDTSPEPSSRPSGVEDADDEGPQEKIDNPVMTPLPATGPSEADALRVIEDLNAARKVCPTFGPVYAVAGQIERLILNRPIGSAHVHTAFALAPAHPEVCLAAAQLDASDGKFDDSLQKALRCLSLDASLHYQLIDLYLHTVDRPDLAVAAMGQDRERLFHVYEALRDERGRSDRPRVRDAMARAREELNSSCNRPDAPAWTLATLGALFREEKDYPRAIACYQQALQKEYGHTDWRLRLAGLLADAGQRDEAVRQAEICLHFHPQMEEALQLIQDVNLRPSVIRPHISVSSESELPD